MAWFDIRQNMARMPELARVKRCRQVGWSVDDQKKTMPSGPRPYFLINNIQVAMIQRLEKDLKPLGITPAIGRVLSAVARRPEISSSKLARIFGISPQSIKQTISGMEALGLIERRPSDTDRRVLRVHLTKKGAAIWRKHMVAIEEMYDGVFSGLNQLEMTMLIGLLTKALQAARPGALDYYLTPSETAPTDPAPTIK